MSILGQDLRRREDVRFLKGEGTYVENLAPDDALHVTFVRSPLAHATIAGIDTSALADRDDVQVFTGADMDAGPFGPPPLPGLEARMGRPLIAKDVVRFAGEIVAAVVTKNRAAGADAAELVMVDYDPLPVVAAVQEAAKDEVLLFPEVGSNTAARGLAPFTGEEGMFDGCEVVVRGTLVSPRMAPCPLEPRTVVAQVGADGRLTVWTPTQAPHQDRMGIAGTLGMDPGDVRVVSPDVGGGFGAKMLSVEEVVLAWLARRLDAAVRWTESRTESMVALHHGRSMRVDFVIGGDREGKVAALRFDILADAGAYPVLGAFLPNLTATMASGVYAIPRIDVESRTVVTNTTPITAFRGAGRPEATQTIERAMDMYAAEIGIDPAEMRRRNFIPNDQYPYTTASGAIYDSGDYEAALDLLLDSAGYGELRAEQRRRREQGGPVQMGIGLCSYIEISNPISETEFGEVEITAAGRAIARTGSCVHGQGHETTFSMIVSEQLGLPIEKVDFHKGDTDDVAMGTGTYGSKSTQLGGSALRLAAEQVLERARTLAGEYLVVETDEPLDESTWAELASRLAADGRLGELKASHEFHSPPSFPFGAHLAVVEVDTETCKVELTRLVAVDDGGTLINPLIARGQVHGGVTTGVAQALFEEFVYDEDGNPLTNSFVGYGFPSAADLPSWEAVEMETPTPLNPLGAKGIGESGTMGATPAVQNAVVDALSPFGVRHVDLPANGENVWRALREVTA